MWRTKAWSINIPNGPILKNIVNTDFLPLYNENYQLTITPVGVSLPSGQSIDEKHTQALTEPVPIVDSQIASQLATKDTTIDSLQAEITALKQQVAYLEGQADFANDLLRDVCKS